MNWEHTVIMTMFILLLLQLNVLYYSVIKHKHKPSFPCVLTNFSLSVAESTLSSCQCISHAHQVALCLCLCGLVFRSMEMQEEVLPFGFIGQCCSSSLYLASVSAGVCCSEICCAHCDFEDKKTFLMSHKPVSPFFIAIQLTLFAQSKPNPLHHAESQLD